MRTRRPREIVVQRLDERRYALAIDGIVRYVGTEAPRRVPPRPATIQGRAYRVQPKESKGGSRSRAAGATQLEAMFHLAVEASTPEVQLQCRRRSAALNTGRRRRFYDWWAS